MTTKQPHANKPSTTLHDGFLLLLPRLEVQARIYFRGLRCPQSKADLIQETIALSFRWYTRLIERRKDPAMFPATFASFAVRAVKCGRRLCGQEPARDVLSSQAQLKHGFRVAYLAISPSRSHERIHASVQGKRHRDAYEEILWNNTHTPVLDQVCFRLDFPAWLATRTDRDRRIINDMALNHRTQDLAHKFGISKSRISHLRREYRDDWTRFCDDLQSDPCDEPQSDLCKLH